MGEIRQVSERTLIANYGVVEILNKQEICWAKRYDRESPWWIEREKEIGNHLRAARELSKADLIEVIEWKFKDLKGRQTRVTRYAKRTDDLVLKKVTRLVFDLMDKKYDEYKLNLLCIFDGIGVAIASVILTFYDPQNYGVFDIHVWRELFGKEPKNLFTTKNCLCLFSGLRTISKKHRLPARIIEKALFKKNYDKGSF